MNRDQTSTTPYRVLVPLSDNETSAQAQTRFVASLPNAATSVEATLTHVLHGEELATSRDLRSAQRVGTVIDARDALKESILSVQIMDVDHPHPPTKGILDLADKLDADLIVLGGGMHGVLDDLLTGNVVKSVGKQTHRPITVISKEFATRTSNEESQPGLATHTSTISKRTRR